MQGLNALSSPSSPLLRAKEQKLQAARKGLEAAAKVKDSDPETYEAVKFQYYSLKNGPAWARQEKMRIEKEKLQPILQEWKSQYIQYADEEEQQKSYLQAIQGIKNKQSVVSSQYEDHVSALQREVDEKEAKTSAYNRLLDFQGPITVSTGDTIASYFAKFPPSVKTILDVLIGLVGLVVVILIARRFSRPVAEAVSEIIPSLPPPPPPTYETTIKLLQTPVTQE